MARTSRADRVRELAAFLRVTEGTAREYVREHEGPEATEKVYIISRGNPELGVPVKIGVAVDPWARMDALQTACPEELVMWLFTSGGRKLERELHKRFADDHLRGEWFRFSRGMLAFALEVCERPARNRIIGGGKLTPAQRRGLEPLPGR